MINIVQNLISNKFLTWGHSKPHKFKSLFNFSSFGRKNTNLAIKKTTNYCFSIRV